jgi:hypothetical protein
MTDSPIGPSETRTSGLSRRWLLVILIAAFLFVLMPFLFWRATWFGRPLTDDEIAQDLADREHPHKTQHALAQIAERILSRDPSSRASARQWYPSVVTLAASPVDELRVTAAWVMGQDNSSQEFHASLGRLLQDTHPMVRRNAALALVRFGDASGAREIRAMLEPYIVRAPQAGTLAERLKPGDTLNLGTLLGRIRQGQDTIEIRCQVPGELDHWLVGDRVVVAAGDPIAAVSPSTEEAWEALRGLFLVGRPEDLRTVERYARGLPGFPDAIQKQAALAGRAIRQRAGE